ncbi:MAG: hypothetical protein LBP89_09075 [Helicobacteraceae bacterium]|jgi:hypothetical protein|nr:hypothetical protein [Helicobacteraceae bacterium]
MNGKAKSFVVAQAFQSQNAEKRKRRKSQRDLLYDGIMAIEHDGIRRLALKIYGYAK